MIRTLFVDDEVGVLEGLENRLRRLRRRWRMDFALGANEALARLDAAPFDAIVTDMRMPGMDGAELLSKVRGAYPGMVRIVLSGQTGREQLLRVLPLAHQILAKPCDVAAIEEAVERARLLQSTLHSPEMKELIAKVKHLPTSPRLYLEVTRLLAEDEVDASAVAQLIAEDVAMTARVLQVVNSGLIGLRHKVATVQEAVTYLGLDATSSLVLSLEVFSAFRQHAQVSEAEVEALQQHSVRTARFAHALVTEHGAGMADARQQALEAFSAGILHDIGRLVLMLHPAPSAQEVARGACGDTDAPSTEAEEQASHGFSHAEVGGALLSLWGLPTGIVEAVVYHHQPSSIPSRSFGPLAAVHVADRIVHARDRAEGADITPEDCHFDAPFMEQLGMTNRLDELVSIANREEPA